MPMTQTTMRLDLRLVDRAVEILRANSRSEAIDMALRQLLGEEQPAAPSKSQIESPTPAA